VLNVAVNPVVIPELSFTVPNAENEMTVPDAAAVRTKGDPKDAEQDPPATRPTQFALGDPGPMLVNVNCAWGSAGIARKSDMGRLPADMLCNVPVLPPDPANAPVLVPRSTAFGPFNERKFTLVWASDKDVDPIARTSA
jgi:hypothetical protein